MFLQASVCPQGGRGCLPQCMVGYTPPPGADTPRSRSPRADHPWEQTPPRADSPLEQTPPERRVIAADGTHPTGMHSCYIFVAYLVQHITAKLAHLLLSPFFAYGEKMWSQVKLLKWLKYMEVFRFVSPTNVVWNLSEYLTQYYISNPGDDIQ